MSFVIYIYIYISEREFLMPKTQNKSKVEILYFSIMLGFN